jgi:hypothetical protein
MQSICLTIVQELRSLDERCEYLRKTHKSLRAGRRNLHERICSYLRSPRVAKFSHDSLLKQEEALAELDLSIEDWVNKVEQAENRRTRVRQKLLEHVAATLIIPDPGQYPDAMEKDRRQRKHDNTPPRSPVKSHSPDLVVRQVQVATPEPTISETDARKEIQSIRVYADSDVYALLADVEDEINRMSENIEHSPSSAIDSAIDLRTPGLAITRDFGMGKEEKSAPKAEQAVDVAYTLSSKTFELPKRIATS